MPPPSQQPSLAALERLASRPPRVSHSFVQHEVERALGNRTLSAEDAHMRRAYVKAAGNRLGDALLDVFGKNQSVGVWALLHSLAGQHDDLSGAETHNVWAPSVASRRLRRAGRQAQALLQPSVSSLGEPRWPIGAPGASPQRGGMAAAIQQAFELHHAQPSAQRLGTAAPPLQNWTRDALARNDSALPQPCKALQWEAKKRGKPSVVALLAESDAPAAGGVGGGGKPKAPMLDKLMNTLGKLCFGGLDQVAAEYAKQSKQNADDAKDKLSRDVEEINKGVVPPCPVGNPLPADVNELYLHLANKMSPETAPEATRLYREWAQGPCPGTSPYNPLEGMQWYKAGSDFGTFYGGLLGANMADPFGRQYGSNELRESPHCYTLLESYLRFCTAPPRALQLGVTTTTHRSHAAAAADASAAHDQEGEEMPWMGWSAAAEAAARANGGAAAHAAQQRRETLATAQLLQSGSDEFGAAASAAAAGLGGAAAARSGNALEADRAWLKRQRAAARQQRRRHGGGLAGSDAMIAAVALRGAAEARERAEEAEGRAVTVASAEQDALTFGGGGAAGGGGGGGKGGRPLAPAQPGIVDMIKGFISELVEIILQMLIRMVKALVPAVIMLILAPLYSVLQVLPILVGQRLIPALLGAPPYPPRTPGFTGPDPYDPYGPDTPEPRPYKNPGFEMCRTMLETYNTNCAFPGSVS